MIGSVSPMSIWFPGIDSGYEESVEIECVAGIEAVQIYNDDQPIFTWVLRSLPEP